MTTRTLNQTFSLLVVGALGLACGTQDDLLVESTSRLTAVSMMGDTTRILAPGATTTLSVNVTDLGGLPQAGVDVLFVAPDEINGQFIGATFAEPNYLRVESDAAGNASVTWTAGASPANYLLDIHVEGRDDVISIAVSQAKGPAPLVSPEDALAKAAQLVGGSGTKLIGPFLLKAGDSIQPARRDGVFPSLAIGPTWFIWADHEPNASFVHDTTFVFMNANDPNAPANPNSEQWWPVLTTEARQFNLRSPSKTNERMEAPSAAPQPALTFGTTKSALTPAQKLTTCAVIVYGPKDRAFRANAAEMKRFFSTKLGLPAANVLTHTTGGKSAPATLASIKTMLTTAKTAGCDRLYLYMTGHGDPESIDFVDATGTKSPTHYSEIAAAVASTFTGNDVVNVIIDACKAGSAISQFQARGLNGEIVTASDLEGASLQDNGSMFSNPGGFFTFEFVEEWEDLLANCPTLDDVFTQIGGPFDTYGNPMSEPITPQGRTFNAPNFVLKVGEVGSGFITGPSVATGGSPYSVANPAVADLVKQIGANKFQTLDKIVLPGATQTRIQARGLSVGTTTYTIFVRTNSSTVAWSATGTIQVKPKLLSVIGGGNFTEGSKKLNGTKTLGGN